MYNTIGMVSLGCAKNQVDAEVMLGILSQQGYKVVNDSAKADIIIVNTCGFIGPAKEESINAILEQVPYKASGRCKVLIAAGCLGERYHDELLAEIPEIDAVVGTGNYARIMEVIEDAAGGLRQAYHGNIHQAMNEVLPRVISTKGPTAYLKIAEGCDNHCTYCIIPQLRGNYRSRSLESLLQEARELVQQGIRELIVIAQDITRYGQGSQGNGDLVLLLRELCAIEDLQWIRLMYCYPDRISDALLQLIAEEEKICKYMDIPIQHIHQGILQRMNRSSVSQEIRDLLQRIRTSLPDVVLRTSIIVGFPGEGEEEFEALLQFVEEGHFQHMGVFSYSREEGTKAAEYAGQVEEHIKEDRRLKVMAAQKRVSKRLHKARIGQICDVLIEGRESSDLYFGRSYGEAPGVDGLIYIYSAIPLNEGEFVKTRVTKSYEYDLLGEVYESRE